MKDIKLITKLVEDGYECDYLDFKAKQYSKESKEELLKDLMAMANSKYSGDKFIIVGVKDSPDGTRTILGIDEFIDSSVYTQIVLQNIEPNLLFDYFLFEYEGKKMGVFRIHSTEDKPYMLKKNYNNLREGLCLIRKGSQNSCALRKDFDDFYLAKERFEVQIMEPFLSAVYDKEACARLRVTIRNLTNLPVTIRYGLLTVKDKENNVLSHHRVYGIDNKIVGADFQLSMNPMTELLCDMFVGFSSTDCLRLNLDEYGTSEERFLFELLLVDTYEREYKAVVDKAIVMAKGDFLWKVQKKVKKERWF